MSDPHVQAFLAFFPMYEMARLRHTAIEDPANPRRHAVNAFNHIRRLLDHQARLVTAPNNDTLYSTARLDLRQGPVRVWVPAMPGRYHSLQFLNAHTDNLAILGSRLQGEGPLQVWVVGPEGGGLVPPPGAQRVDSDTHEVWLLVRLLVDGPHDLPAVAALQDALQLDAPRPAADYPRQHFAPPKDPDPAAFLRGVNEMLSRNPPRGLMAREAEAARPLGLGVDAPDWDALPAPLREAWLAAWPAAQAALHDPGLMVARRVGGWEYPPEQLGRWGDRLALRAAVALRGIGALDREEALYLSASVDATGRPLEGQRRYRLKMPPGGLPARAFWSLSMYERLPDGRCFFSANALARYSVGNRTPGLQVAADGSVTLCLQPDEPAAGPANWLPAPAGPFSLMLRAYDPVPGLVAGVAPLPEILALAD